MNFEIVDNIMNINLDPTLTLALAGILLLVGYSVKKQVNALNKYCIPAPVIGGFIFMFIAFIGHKTGAFKFNFENTFQSTFMLAFFYNCRTWCKYLIAKKRW